MEGVDLRVMKQLDVYWADLPKVDGVACFGTWIDGGDARPSESLLLGGPRC